MIGAYSGALAGLHKRLDKGEKGLVPIICPSKLQGRIIMGYLRAIFETPILKQAVANENKDSFELINNVRVECLAGDYRSVRGYSILQVILDEAAFFQMAEDSRIRSDTELVRALLPALATCRGRMVAISSPYSKRGYCWSTYRKHYGNNNSRILVWNCPSRTMNPTLPQSVVDAALEEDRAAALSEYMGQFRDDVGLFIAREVVEGLVEPGRVELLPSSTYKHSAFVDMSGGRTDASALAIGHRKEAGKVVLDFCRQWKSPANPHEVTASMVEVLRKFGVKKVTGDQFAGEWPVSAFASHGIRYVKADRPKSQIYAEFLPVLTTRSIELLDDETLVNQLCGLERRTRSGGRDIIDHPRGSHDDLANAVAGLAVCKSRCIVPGAGVI